MNSEFSIINTGGTFNKKYNQISGKLEVMDNNEYIVDILNDIYKDNLKPNIHGLIFKDSLEINKNDRKKLKKLIKKIKQKNIIIIHGTDTMDITAKYLSKKIKNKNIVLTGSMQPFSISKVECTGNIMMSIGFLKSIINNNIYICMNGNVEQYNKIIKNHKKGVFQIYEGN